MKRTRLARLAATVLCVTIKIVCPFWLILSNKSNVLLADFESNAPVGSSAKSKLGSVIIARPIATRCCWPPDNSYGYFFNKSSMPNISAIGWTFFSISSIGRRANTSGNTILSYTDNVSNKLKSWKTNPKWSRRNSVNTLSEIFWMSSPFRSTVPSVGRSSVAKIFNSVVLPEPDSPMTATYSPSSTEKLISFNAVTSAAPKRVW